MDDPIRKSSAKYFRKDLQIDRMPVQWNPTGLSMKSEIKNVVSVPSGNHFEVVDELLRGVVAGEVDEFDSTMAGNEIENSANAEAVFEVMVPKGLKANNILFNTSY